MNKVEILILFSVLDITVAEDLEAGNGVLIKERVKGSMRAISQSKSNGCKRLDRY